MANSPTQSLASRVPKRHPRSGITLITTLLMLLLLASFAAALQNRLYASTRVFIRIWEDHQIRLDQASAMSAITPLYAEALLGQPHSEDRPPMNSEPFEFTWKDQTWIARGQDLGGLPDAFLTPVPVVETWLGESVDGRVLDALWAGGDSTTALTHEQLARALSFEASSGPVVSLLATGPRINIRNSPERFETGAGELPRAFQIITAPEYILISPETEQSIQ